MIILPIGTTPRSPVPPATAPSTASFDQTFAATTSLQDVPGLGTLCRALGAEQPLSIVGAAARGFLLGGPAGAAVGGGLAALAPFFHLPLPAGNGVTGDQSRIQPTESRLAAYSPLAHP